MANINDVVTNLLPTLIGTVKTSVDAVESAVDGLETSATAIDTSCNDIETAVEALKAGPLKTPITKTISAENTYSDPLSVDPYFDAVLKISGVSGDIVTLQQRYNSGAWEDRETFTSDISGHLIAVAESSLELRVGIKTSEFGAGAHDVLIRLSQG